jgi:hypothetical protein
MKRNTISADLSIRYNVWKVKLSFELKATANLFDLDVTKILWMTI